MTTTLAWTLALTAGLTSSIAGAQRHAPSDPYDTWALERCESPYFLIEDGDPATDRFPLESTEVFVRIEGMLAEVRVRQRYTNEGARPLSARYVFPASVRAAVHGMSMQLDERVIRARIAERAEARATYAAAKAEGRGAALLEQERPNVFQMEVANVLAGETVEVELVYSELLVPEDGVYELVYPTVVGPRYTGELPPYVDRPARRPWAANPYLHAGEAPPSTFALAVELSTGIPLAALDCDTHATSVEWSGASSARVALEASESAGGDRDFVLRYKLVGERIQTGLLLQRAEGAELGHFLLMVEPPARPRDAEIPPREYVFVLDVSGSMQGYPLATARRLVQELIRPLRPTDTFNVVLFAGGSELLASRSLEASAENVEQALAFMRGRGARGGTELSAALERALALPRTPGVARSLLVVTDGFVAAEADAFRLIHDNIADTNVFAFGIGSSVNRYLVEGLARAGQGEATIVKDAGGAIEAVERFRRYVSVPVLTDVRVESVGFELLDREPATFADLMAARPLVLSGRWRGEPRGTLTLTGTGGAGPFRQTLDVAAVEPSATSALASVWARRRVAALADWNFGHPTDDQRREILELGLSYGLLTDFTSFVAVTTEVRTDGEPSDEVVQPLPLPKGVSDYAVGGAGVGSGDEPPFLVLAALAAALLVAHRFRRRALVRDAA